MSEGFYVRQNHGKEYEVGVAYGDVLWRLSLELAIDGPIALALTWSVDDDLDVYVDGIAAGTALPTYRVFTNPMHDPFADLVVGIANDDRSGLPSKAMAIWNVTFTEKHFHESEIIERIGKN